MGIRSPFTLALLACFAAPGAALADHAQDQASVLGARIESRNEPHGSGTQWGRATGVVDAPTATVLKIITDYERYDEFMPHFKQAKVLSRRGNDALVYMEVDIMKGATKLWGQLKVKQVASRGATQVFEAKLQKGNMDQFLATWELTPLDGGKRTLVDFKILVEPDLPLPSALFSAENKKAAARSLKALRKRTVAPTLAAR